MVDLHRRILDLIRSGELPADHFDEMACALFDWQRKRNLPLSKISDALYEGVTPTRAEDIPAVPTDVFKVDWVCSFDHAQAARVFLTSGTTADVHGRHAFGDLSHYTESLISGASCHLLPASQYRIVALTADERESPNSSLGFMLSRFVDHWHNGAWDPFFVKNGRLEADRMERLISTPSPGEPPVALLGPSFGFVHFLEAYPEVRVNLGAKAVIMPTGGFKGRSRELSPEDLYERLCRAFGVEDHQIVGEYGMTELSSQAYETVGRDGRWYRVPPWMRVTAVDPDDIKPLPHGQVGLLRVVDLANVWSSVAILTSDLGVTSPRGFRVLGRVSGAAPRGCARALDALLLGDVGSN